LEKFAMKQESYDLPSVGNDSFGNIQGSSIYNFLNRAYGFLHDDAALQWSCPLRNWLKLRTGEATYLRPGLSWYRNPEFGKLVEDPRKRGRKGAPLKESLGWREINPYHYPENAFHPKETLRNYQRGKPIKKMSRKDYSSLQPNNFVDGKPNTNIKVEGRANVKNRRKRIAKSGRYNNRRSRAGGF
jgi:hypothetical protein